MRTDLSALILVCAVSWLGACAMRPVDPAESAWSITAELVECCCCDAICPCIVGSPPTRGRCLGNRLIVIEDGHYGGVEVDGITAVITFHIGKWSKLYVDDDATADQAVAVRKLLELQWASLFRNVLEVEQVPVEYSKTASTYRFSVPAAEVDIEVMEGAGGNPIEVRNLRSFRDYVQYESKKLTHTCDDEDQSFEFSGTNGFVARHAATG